MRSTIHMTRLKRRSKTHDGSEGMDFVSCRICGDRRRVISGRHLSKHGIDRETYMEEYGLGPDELVANDFRMLHSSRQDYRPYSKREWIAAIQQIHRRNGNVLSDNIQEEYRQIYDQGRWLFGSWDNALHAAGFDPEKTRVRVFWDKKRLIKEIRRLRERNLPVYPHYVLEHHAKLFSKALRQYGSWDKALVTAGVAKNGVGRRYGSRFLVLRGLRDVLERNSKQSIPASLEAAAAYYFGSVRKALRALKTDRRLARGWSKRKIIGRLVQIHRSMGGLGYAAARRDRQALVSAAEAYFGSWGKALCAAGIDPNIHFVRHTRRKR